MYTYVLETMWICMCIMFYLTLLCCENWNLHEIVEYLLKKIVGFLRNKLEKTKKNSYHCEYIIIKDSDKIHDLQ